MRFKKIVSGLLACAMVVTSAFAGNVSAVSAAETAPAAEIMSRDAVEPVSSYDFDVDVSDDNAKPSLGDGVEAFTAGCEGTATVSEDAFVAGRSGKASDKALNLGGKFGIRLPDKNIGADYTVSMWVKRTDAMTNNFMPLLWLGGNGQYIAAAGAWHSSGTTEDCILWGGGIDSSEEPHFRLTKNVWEMLTITQSGETVSIYRNEECLKTITKAGLFKPLDGDGKQIYVGVNPYVADGLFPAVVDDINVFDKALTTEQIADLCDPRSDEEKFVEGELVVSPSFEMVVGKSRTVSVTLPQGISRNKLDVSFTSDNQAVAEVDAATGVITAKAVGTAEITTTVTLKGSAAAPKTKKTTVTVSEGNGKEVIVDYDFEPEDTEAKVLTDKAGDHDATIHGATAKFENGTLTLKGGAATASDPDYVDLPKSILDDLDDPEQFTIEVEFTKSSNVKNAWLFCLGATPASTGYNYLFLSPNFEDTALRSGIRGNEGGSSATEKLFKTSIHPEINKSYTVSMVFDNGALSLYWNGIKIKGEDGDHIDSGYSLMDDVVANGCKGNILGYIGKSCWSPDGYFNGTISKFKVYNRAMNDEEVQGAFAPTFDKIFKEDMKVANILGRNESKDAVRYNLSLPTAYEEAPVTWTSSNTDVISDKGIVNNPTVATKVTMTAKVVSGKLEGTTSFELTVQPADKAALNEKIAEAQAELENKYRSDSSKDEIRKLIGQANAATGQTDIDKFVNDIDKLLKKMDYSPLYMNPFTELEDFNPAISNMITLAPNATATVKAKDVSAEVKDAVDVAYESLAENVAVVDENGMVTGKSVGYAMIVTRLTAKYDKYAQEYFTLVKVDLDLSGVKASAEKTLLAKGQTTQIKVTVPNSIPGAAKTYRATGAVTVDKSGKITAKAGGTGKVYVKVSAAGKSIMKTVTVNVAELTGAASVKAKKSITLKVNGPKGMKVKWSLDKKGAKLAKITQKGKLTAKKKGKVTVTAKVTVGKQTVSLTKEVNIKK